MSFPQHAMSTGSKKRARDEADEDNLDNHISKYQAMYSLNPSYRASGVEISSNSAVAQVCTSAFSSVSLCICIETDVVQSMWQIPTIPQPAQTGTMAPQIPFSELIPSAQLGHARGTATALPVVFQGNRGAQGVISPLQPINYNTGPFERFEREGSSSLPPRSRTFDRSNAPSYVDPQAASSVALEQRAAPRQRFPATVNAYLGYNQLASDPSGQQLGSNGRPYIQQQQHRASIPVAHQTYRQAPSHRAATPAQPQMYQPTRSERTWFDIASHQLSNPFHYVPAIPINAVLPPGDRLLFPYEVLQCRFLRPDQRYCQYTDYCKILLLLYGMPRPHNCGYLKYQLNQISGYLKEREERYLQWRQDHLEDLQHFKQDCNQNFPLAQFGLSLENYPVTMGGPPVFGSQPSYSQNDLHPPATTTRRHPPGTAPVIYMPSPNRVSYQATVGPQQGYFPPELPRGNTRQAFAPPHTVYGIVARLAVDQYSGNAYRALHNAQPPSMGYQAPESAFSGTIAGAQQLRPSLQNHQRGRLAPGNTSSAAIIIDDDDQPDQLTSSYIEHTSGWNAATKRRRSDDQGRSAKMPRTASYTKAIDLTNDSNEAATSPSLQAQSPASVLEAPTRVRKTFENSENTKEFEEWASGWEADKQTVQSTLPGQLLGLSPALLLRYNNGEFKCRTAWEAYIASRKHVWLAEEREKERKEKINAQRKREREKKKQKAQLSAQAAQEEKMEAKQKAEQRARQEMRRLDREEAQQKEAEEKAEQAQTAQNKHEAVTQDELVNLFIEGLEEESNEASTTPSHTSTEATSSNDDEGWLDSIFGDVKDDNEETSISPNGIPTETTSPGDEDEAELESLFDGDEDDDHTTGTSPEDDSMIPSKITNAEPSKPVALEEPATASTVLESAQSEQRVVDFPAEEISQDATEEDDDGEEGYDSDEQMEEDPEIAAINAHMRALDEEIAEKSAQLSNTANRLFRARAQTLIDRLYEKKRALENEVARLYEERNMAEVEADGGL